MPNQFYSPVPQVDFSGLGDLPKIYREGQQQAARQRTLAELGANPDEKGLSGAALKLAQAGDMAGATSLATLGKTLAAPEQTDLIKNYNYAQKQGFTGSLFDYENAIKKAGATKVTQNVQSGEKAYDTKVGAEYGDTFVKLNKDARDASGAVGTLNLMDKLTQDPRFYSGAGGELVTTGKKALAGLGVTAPDSASPNELFGALGNKLVLESAGGSLGTGFSNADRDFIQRTVPTLGTTPEGNRALIGMQRKVYERKQEVAQLARNYAKNNGGRIDAGFDQALAEWTAKNPLFPQAQGGGQPAAQPAPAVQPAQQTQPKQAPDGKFYIPDPQRPGKYLRVVQ